MKLLSTYKYESYITNILDFEKNIPTYFSKYKFLSFLKTGIYVVWPCLDLCWHAKFQAHISIFGKHIEQKHHILTAIFSIFGDRTEIKWHFLNPEIKQVQKHTFLIRKYQLKNLTLYYPGLTWPFSVLSCI